MRSRIVCRFCFSFFLGLFLTASALAIQLHTDFWEADAALAILDYGRATLIDCMRGPRLLLVRYNAAAQEMNQAAQQSSVGSETLPLALWPREILVKTRAPM